MCVCVPYMSVCADLPTCLYLAVFVQKLAGSMDVCEYFSKFGQGISLQHELL